MRVNGQLEFAQLEQTIPGSVSAIGARIYADITAPAAIIPKFHNGSSYYPMLLGGLNQLGSLDFAAQSIYSGSVFNLGLSCSVAANALTIALKQNDGSTNANATSPVVLGFRSSTAANGVYNLRPVTGALAITVPSSATLGHTSGANYYIWVYALDNAGAVELAVSGVNLFPDQSIQSSTSISAGSTSGSVLYSATGRTSVPIRLIGRLLVNEVTAGTWVTAPTDVVLCPSPVPNETDWVAYTAGIVGLGTIASQTIKSRRSGDCLEIKGFVSTGTPTGVSATISLGFNGTNANVTADTNKLTDKEVLGSLIVLTNLATAGTPYVQAKTADLANLYFGIQLTTGATTSVVGTTLFSGAGTMTFYARIPISTWSTYGP